MRNHARLPVAGSLALARATGDYTPEAAEQGWRFLEKPFSADQLLRAVEDILKRSEQARERARPA